MSLKYKKYARNSKEMNRFCDFFELSDEFLLPSLSSKISSKPQSAHVLGEYLFFFGLTILFDLFDSDFREFFRFFLQIGMILVPLRVVFIILVPSCLENSSLGKTSYFLENLFCLVSAILLIIAVIMSF